MLKNLLDTSVTTQVYFKKTPRQVRILYYSIKKNALDAFINHHHQQQQKIGVKCSTIK